MRQTEVGGIGEPQQGHDIVIEVVISSRLLPLPTLFS
jgi:hypothetical protein